MPAFSCFLSRERNFFDDLLFYRSLVNIVIHHGTDLSYIRNVDPMIAFCGFENKQDLNACLRIFPGVQGHIQMKPHDASYYSYLQITTTLIDDSRSYDSVFEYTSTSTLIFSSFHAKSVSSSPFASKLPSEEEAQSNPHKRLNLHIINCTYHSVLCRQLFRMLHDGCLLLLKQGSIPCTITMGNESVLLTVDKVFSIKIELKNAGGVLTSEEKLEELLQAEWNSRKRGDL